MKKDIGILVGANERQEWLLPWWWENYSLHNSYPVSFVDFGLSEEMKDWCKARGELIALYVPPLFVKDREEVSAQLVKQWERYPDGFWDSREAWFKKPLACLQSPYEWTLWIDLDCEIVGPLERILEYRLFGIALAKDPIAFAPIFPIYNSGVILFQNNHPLVVEWAREAGEKNGLFRGDQDLLSLIIAERNYPLSELPLIYNWCIRDGKREDVIIYHWSGDSPKEHLRRKLILKDLERTV